MTVSKGILHLAALLCSIGAFLSTTAAGDSIGTLQIPGCDTAVITPDAPGGDTGAASFVCPIGTGIGGSNAGGMATVTAGFDHFSNTISPLSITGSVQQQAPESITIVVTSFPTWGPGVNSVPTRLFLSGTVRKAGNEPASISFTETGLLGGPALMLQSTYTGDADVNLEAIGNQAPSNTATLTLTATVQGPIVFTAIDSAEFLGAIPEPSSAFLFVAGLIGLGLTARWRSRMNSR